jgi:LAO/AO transport system kinase
MASRGALGGLARATAGVAQVLDAAGFDVVIIETVGAGQSEVDIARLAHTTLVVEAPGLGDDIQAIKAGILEIADILVINKADLPGADNTERSLRMMLELADPGRQHYTKHHELEAVDLPEMVWRIPVIKTVAAQGQGIDELAAAVAGHRDVLRASGEWQIRDQARLQGEFDLLLQSELLLRWRSGFPPEQLQELQKQMFARQLSPYQAARICVEQRQK